jgi:hypothetical protein
LFIFASNTRCELTFAAVARTIAGNRLPGREYCPFYKRGVKDAESNFCRGKPETQSIPALQLPLDGPEEEMNAGMEVCVWHRLLAANL